MKKINFSLLAVCILSLTAVAYVYASPRTAKTKSEAKASESANTAAQQITSSVNSHAEIEKLIAGQMKWRPVGPANMGGRIADIAVDPANPFTIYVATATGGLIKTTDNGTTWAGIFEHEAVASTGAVAVAPSDSKVVWLGTGEPNGRNSSSWGGGVYKSTDGGGSWTNMGLKDSQDISRIRIDPSNADIVYVAALGHLWGPNKERGVYKTTDGGKTWTASLQVDENTGAIDLLMDPVDHSTLYAAMYYRRRTAYSMKSGGPTGGVYKSTDAGRNWKKITSGLPAETGRIGIDLCLAHPNVLYAVIESDIGGQSGVFDSKSKSGGVFRSDDKGETWKRVNGIAPRSFYFSQIRVDPKDENRVYVPAFEMAVSDDGGKTFRTDGAKGVHSDMHAMWIDPKDTDHILLGTDGGVYVSYSKTKTWSHYHNIGIGEFYRVAVDMQTPYRIAGGLQDNFNWLGVSQTRNSDGITNAEWQSLGGGDGMYCAIDPENPNIIYSESQNGSIYRTNLATGEQKGIQPSAKEGAPAYRFNWTTPFLLSHYDHNTIYVGGNHLFKLTEQGEKWEEISPDLSAQDVKKILTVGSGAETYGTIFAIGESPLKQGLIWIGTDDGKVWVTRDDGKNWTDLTGNLPTETKGLWVSRIQASNFDEGTAYLAVDGHRDDIYSTLLYVTRDFGKTWKSIVNDLPEDQPVQAVYQDPKNKNLLFVGTEFGFYLSFNDGGHWTKFNAGLPVVAVDDILVHPRDLDLVIGTHGRSIYVMDDIRPLEEATPEVLASDLHLFSVRPALEYYYLPQGEFMADGDFKVANPPFGAYINFYVKSFNSENYTVTIKNSAGETVNTMSGAALPGITRVVWNLRGQPQGEGGAVFVKPGEYTVAVSVGKNSQSGKITVKAVDGLKIED